MHDPIRGVGSGITTTSLDGADYRPVGAERLGLPEIDEYPAVAASPPFLFYAASLPCCEQRQYSERPACRRYSRSGAFVRGFVEEFSILRGPYSHTTPSPSASRMNS